MKIFRGVVSLLMAVAVLSCDAPHLNPLDPQNGGYNFGQLSGNVVDENYIPIQKVKVIFKNSNTVAQTDASGNFKLDDVPLYDSWLYFERDGYGRDSVEIKWNNQKSKSIGQKILYSTIGEIDGTVVNSDKIAIPGVKVIFKKTYITETDGLGQFKMQNLPLSDGIIYFEKEGWGKDSVDFKWGGSRIKNIGSKTLYSTIGQIEGTVINTDRNPISGVKVIFKKTYITETDGFGQFKLQNLPLSDGKIYFEKDGYGRDSIDFKWEGLRIKNIGQKTLVYTIGQVEGTVFNPDKLPISAVEVIFNNAYVSYSDGTGLYRLYNLPMSDGWIYFQKDGYKRDSVEVRWNGQKIKYLGQKTLAYSIGSIEGFIFNSQRIGISGAKIVFRNNYITQTDASGQFKLQNVPMTDGWFTIEKSGFAKDSVFVQWVGEKTKRYEVRLNYVSGFLDGYVKQDVNHNLGLANVRVLWKPQNMIAYTDKNGYYKFDNLSHTDGMIYFEMNGYNKDSVYVQWSSNNESIRVGDRFLNAMPTLENISISSIVENEQGGGQRYSMSISAGITDIDDYIDSVIVRCTPIGFYKRLKYNPTTEMYEHTETNMYTVDEAVGKNFEVIVKDKAKRTFLVGSSTIKRVITKAIETISPKDGKVVVSKPTFVWTRFSVGFNFRYKLQVYTSTFGLPSELVYEKADISKDDIQLTMSYDLNAGSYYWVIWCIDDFSNAARSAPASFTVQ